MDFFVSIIVCLALYGVAIIYEVKKELKAMKAINNKIDEIKNKHTMNID